MKALKKVCVLLTALILSGTAGVSVFAGAEEQMTTAWLNAANQLWENDWISRDGKIDYLEDSVSSIEEKLNSYDNCKVERINENKIGLVHYEPYFSFYVAASDSEYDSSNGYGHFCLPK